MENVKNRYNRENLSSIVANYIKESILSGVYKEGDHILESEVAFKLGISRAPVREAIKELEKEGIVTLIPRKGTYVTKFTIEDIKEIFDIRLLLENDIINILIKEDKLNDRDFKHLEYLVKDMVNVRNSNKSDKNKAILINVKDTEFHKYLWQKSGSKRRVKILEDIFFQLRIAMLFDTNETGNLLLTATDHYDIIDNLRNKDIEMSKQSLRNHIFSYKEGRF
ncbi:GntR family transcriptional regulator [Sedimentibacter sp. MB31-C6]|uniref:GntR family transcriptional regulator n=1 Tax=Sedimentibacter sp. MB31-C6 TaxID=3109366 RepID=UPI002DDCCAFF|nr:GntR family transcriptional regulator [Sedimentibacter sp. MB36-C1]WSI03446.1 GntR family transcriptional regulator [Sedimentibacter sp. MB36-C1]